MTKRPPGKEIIKGKKKLPVTSKYLDVNSNEVTFNGKLTVQAENRGIRKNLTLLITKREDIKPLLGMEVREFNWTIRKTEKSTTQTN